MMRLLFWLLLLLSFLEATTLNKELSIVNAELDLSEYTLDDIELFPLQGEWEFYWQELLKEKEFETKTAALLQFPTVWNELTKEDKPLGSQGVATFRATIYIRDNHTVPAIYIPYPLSAYRIYVNDSLVAFRGEVHSDLSKIKEAWQPQIRSFKSSSKLEFVIHIANKSYFTGGMRKPILLGSQKNIIEYREKKILYDALFIGLVLTLFIFGMTLAILNNLEKSAPYLSLFSLSLIVYILTSSEMLIYKIFPEIPWIVMVKLFYISSLMLPITVFAFWRNIYPAEFNKKVLSFFIIVTMLYTFGIMMLPAHDASNLFKAFHMVGLIESLMIVYYITLATIHKRVGALASAIGAYILIVATIQTVLYVFGWASVNANLFYALSLFIVMQIVMLGVRLSWLFMQVENQERCLQEKVKDAVSISREKDLLLIQQSKMASMGEMIASIAHQWKQPLSVITALVANIEMKKRLDGVDNTLSEHMDIQDQVSFMLETMNDFRSFFKPDKQTEPFKAIEGVNYILKLFGSQYKKDDVNIVVSSDDTTLTSFKNEYQQVLLNIINNARDNIIKNNPKRRDIHISIRKVDDSYCHVAIEDFSGGIDSMIFDKIFEAYVSTKGSNGTGIGLYMSNEIVENIMQGELQVNNTKEGACFTLILPLVIETRI